MTVPVTQKTFFKDPRHPGVTAADSNGHQSYRSNSLKRRRRNTTVCYLLGKQKHGVHQKEQRHRVNGYTVLKEDVQNRESGDDSSVQTDRVSENRDGRKINIGYVIYRNQYLSLKKKKTRSRRILRMRADS